MLLAHLLLSTSAAQAAEFGFGLYGGHWALPTESEFNPAYVYGARLRLRPTDGFGLEISGGKAADLPDDGMTFDPRLELMKFFPNKSKVTPFVALGGGLLVGADSMPWLVDLGGGVDAELVNWLDFRADVRMRLLGEEEPRTGVNFTAGLQLHTSRFKDADADGIRDRDDQCKDQAEDKDNFKDEDGCPDPDNDNDGVGDAEDQCGAEAEDKDGFKDADGCPDPDNDDDGIADNADKCPAEPEDKDQFEDSDGCADKDNDKDGIADADDKAPNAPETFNGFQDADGAPDEVPKEVERFSGVIQGINFETGKATLLPSSSKILDEAVEVLKKFEGIRLEVQGHTDDVGDDAKNLKLSQDRAQAVVDYFVKKGISADRFVAKGYGETAPKVPNTDSKSRAENRRVEFKRIGHPGANR